MDLWEADNARKLSAVPLSWFFFALNESLALLAEHPLEDLVRLSRNGMKLYPGDPRNAGQLSDPMDANAVISTLEAAIRDRMDSADDDSVFYRKLRFSNPNSNALLGFNDIWVLREDVKNATQSIGADRFPWPRAPWPYSADDWLWIDLPSSPDSSIAAACAEATTATTLADPCSAVPNRFVLSGDSWEISFGGAGPVHLRNSKGIKYIAWLIRNSGKEVFVIDLDHAVNPAAPGVTDPTLSAMTAGQLEEIGLTLNDFGDADDPSSHEESARLKNEIQKIMDRIGDAEETGDTEQVERLKQERQDIINYMAGIYGVDGKPRKQGSNNERVRINVTTQITRAKKKISEHLPDLTAHLDAHLTTGTRCRYAPVSAIDWEIIGI